MATVIDSITAGSDHAELCIRMPHFLLFCLQRASKSRGRFTTDVITNIFLQYDPKIDNRIGVDQEKTFIKYFVRFWSYPLKDKVKGATRPRKFRVVTNRIFVENLRRLALMEEMTLNEFCLKVLSERMIEELQDPMLYRRCIPDY